MQAYNKEKGRLFFKTYNGFTVDFDIRKPITQLLGDSATGKSFISNMIAEYKKSEDSNNTDVVYTFNNIEVINRKKDLDLIEKPNAELIVIDRGNFYLTENDISLIQDNKKEKDFLIIARGLPNLDLTPNYIAELIEQNGTFHLTYKFSVKGWW